MQDILSSQAKHVKFLDRMMSEVFCVRIYFYTDCATYCECERQKLAKIRNISKSSCIAPNGMLSS